MQITQSRPLNPLRSFDSLKPQTHTYICTYTHIWAREIRQNVVIQSFHASKMLSPWHFWQISPRGNGIECQHTTSHFKVNFRNRFQSVAYTHESTNDQDLELAVNNWYCIDVEVQRDLDNLSTIDGCKTDFGMRIVQQRCTP